MRAFKIVAGLMLSVLMMVGAATSRAVTITFDEDGHAIGTVGQGSFGINLTYQLPFDVTTGVLFVTDSILLTAPLEDVLGFFDNGVVAFVSVNTDGVDSLADQSQGFAISLNENSARALEVGPEGVNGFVYTPLAGQPGFNPNFAVTYNVLSDGTLVVPEPATFALLPLGILLLLFGQRRLRRAICASSSRQISRLVINLKTANAPGLTIPQALLLRADEGI